MSPAHLKPLISHDNNTNMFSKWHDVGMGGVRLS